jgi:hypothetical protein
VAGGDGFSGRRNRGIDPSNGRIVDAVRRRSNVLARMVGDGQYHRVAGVPYVDGVFIPSSEVAVPIDSAGHVFDKFDHADNSTWQHIWAGGKIPNSPYLVKMDGVDYASPGHGHLFFHANSAITFDLEAVRRGNPAARLVQFRAVVGNIALIAARGKTQYADAWVMVDGRSRCQYRQLSRWQGALPVLVPINDQDRFLTLAATEGNDGISHDFIVFGDPRLELLLVETRVQEQTERKN